jgi:hypothetical protein
MDEFLIWILECYISGDMTESEIDKAVKDRSLALELFFDCWKCDKIGTGEMAQELFKQAKLIIASMKHAKRQ